MKTSGFLLLFCLFLAAEARVFINPGIYLKFDKENKMQVQEQDPLIEETEALNIPAGISWVIYL